MGDIDALIVNVVDKAFVDFTPEALTPLSTARPYSAAGVRQTECDDLIRWAPAAPSRSSLEQTLYKSKLASACDAVVACLGAEDLLRFTCLSPACERVILQRRAQHLQAFKNDVLQAQVVALQAQIAKLLSDAKNSKPKPSALQEIFNNPGMSSIALTILQCLSPPCIHQLACVSPSTSRDVAMSFIQLQRSNIVELRTKIIEDTYNLSTARQEVQSLWKTRWQRLEEVAEQNRRMRCPTPVFVRTRLPEYKPNAFPLGATKLSSQEAQEHYDALDKSSCRGIVDVANKELSDFKAAYASFVTSWSKAVDIAETLGTDDVDKLKGEVVSLARSPQKWSEKEWCKEAIRMAAGNKKPEPRRTTSKVL